MSVAAPRQIPSSDDRHPLSGDLERLLSAALAGLGAADGIVWVVDSKGEPVPLHQSGLGQQSVRHRHAEWQGHADLLRGILATGEARAVQARFEPDRPGEPGRDLRIIVHPVAVDGESVGLLELFLPTVPSQGALSDEQALRLLGGLTRAFRVDARPVASVAAASPSPSSSLEQLLELSLRSHQSLDVLETAYAVVAEAQRVLGADRVTLLRQQRGRCRVLAMSGVDRPDARSAMVRQLERFGRSAAGRDEPLRYSRDGGEPGIPLDLREEFREYAERVSLQQFETATLRRGTEPISLLIVEDFSARPQRGWPLLPAVATISASAMGQAIEHSELPLFGLSHRLRNWGLGRSRLRAALKLAALLGLVAGGIALATIRTRFEIVGRGMLVPQTRRDVFAPLAGVVEKIAVRHGQDVARGETVLTLRSPSLDFELTRVQGELQTAEQQIADITSLRTDPTRPQTNRSSDAELAAREEELKSVRDNLRKQRTLLEEQRTRQAVLAPVAGRVFTWDVGQLLEERPVERGQRLLTIGAIDGPWIVEIRVPDRDVGHLQRAIRGDGHPAAAGNLDAVFSVTTDLDRQIPARVESIADIVEDDPAEGPTVLVTLSFSREDLRELLPGVTAVGKIDCGERPVGYVWFRRLIDAVKTWWLF